MRRKYRYKYEDIACIYCYDNKKSGSNGKCRYKICPYILENLPDLLTDGKFCRIADNPDNCTTNHKKTLEYLNTLDDKENHEFFSIVTHERCDFKNECSTCNYGKTGFVCLGNDGTCLKDWLRDVRNGGNSHAGS